ncbi:protein of unknown function (DUF1987) [Desulfosporosinus orientis DSM 765]|uniref:SiaC family regulatory phosphoprotein domain-containing protein n=1 Tax=Desulfosporosinus orientis (strain ATCC 19365 / DSM 765 / NCIMB 8382 / VKM B-1628 / Singapore I) TaxID=768706 RepID=G7WED5_DESOD|nr:DUF1987 domain-containing protein [Desulfosporosinus orientis]AET70748.1 protein of unknown function (DUF1987) [Desulfosporosinus orientis DSM 765]
MEKLLFEPTKATPMIDFDPDKGILIIKGQSYPENAFKFYDPVFTWIDTLLATNPSELKVEVRLSYVNTSSSKCIMMLLENFEKSFQQGVHIQLNWYCDMENESEVECAEEFKEDITFPFNIIPEVNDH